MDKITSRDYNIQSIIEEGISFNIPRYQRLFVWQEEQVNTLFNDILTATVSGKEFYYIGGIITVKYDKIENCYDLVDGQQRFTTLWLLANELGTSLDSFTKRDGDLRLNFSIRKNVKDFFNKLLKDRETEASKTDFDDLVRISKAQRTLNSLISENLKTEDERKQFTDFVLNKLKMVITNVPPDTDLNKLFETLNNRGIQLSQHEILKAQLLSKIPDKETRYIYSKLWNACSNMNDYLERNLAKEIGKARDIASKYNWIEENGVWRESLAWNEIRNLINSKHIQKEKTLDLKEILKPENKFENIKEGSVEVFHQDASADEFEKVRSILSFPQLLLHTLRIYLHKQGKNDIRRINEKELLETFDTYFFKPKDEQKNADDGNEQTRYFINLLAEIREVFDMYVIKWVEIEENKEVHLIKKIKKRNRVHGSSIWYLVREKTTDLNGLALLQSILYHSQQNTTQYWLTPFLMRLLKFPSYQTAYTDLKKMDNILLSSMQAEKSLPERTWAGMNELPDIQATSKIFLKNYGVGFPHYWFYKMEFVLWHERAKLNKEEQWKDYKMTARNSVEHISPQNPRNASDKLCKEEVNAFGNLVLVTRSINSEYSDLPYSVKKAKFEDKKTKGSIDSLKSDLIYAYPEWDDEQAVKHRDKMITIIDNYFKEN